MRSFIVINTAQELTLVHQLPNEALITAKEAALFLNIKETTLAWYRCQELGPNFTRLGAKLIRYKVGDLREYTKSQPMSEGMRRVANAMLVGRTQR